MLRKSPRRNSRINLLRPLACLLLLGPAFAGVAAAQSVPFPTYQVGENQNGSQGPDYPSTLPNPWVVSERPDHHPRRHPGLPRHHDPRQGHRAEPEYQHAHRRRPSNGRPTGRHDFQHPDRRCPADLHTVLRATDPDGSNTGITYTPDGKYLLFSQDGNSFYGSLKQGASLPSPASIRATGMLSDYAHVSVPMDVNAAGDLTTVTCFPNSPGGTTGSFEIPCG